MTTPRIHALIPAAGTGVRFGAPLPKQYASLHGRPVIAHSIATLLAHPAISGVTVALSATDEHYDSMVAPSFPDVDTVVGGPTRAQTVFNGLQHILEADPLAHWVMVHDAARPCLSAGLVTELVKSCETGTDGAILAIPVSDTVKKAGANEEIVATIDRNFLWQAQTPQLFPTMRLATALKKSLESATPPTDEASAMESSGASPQLVMGSRFNINITSAEDLALAEAILNI